MGSHVKNMRAWGCVCVWTFTFLLCPGSSVSTSRTKSEEQIVNLIQTTLREASSPKHNHVIQRLLDYVEGFLWVYFLKFMSSFGYDKCISDPKMPPVQYRFFFGPEEPVSESLVDTG